MRVCKGFVGLAVLMLTIGGVARADDTNSNNMGGADQPVGTDQPAQPGNDQTESPNGEATPAPTAAPTYGPLMQGLEKIGIGTPMENLGFNIHGFIEGGYLYDFDTPTDITPAKSAPGDDIFFAGPYKNAPMLNQLDLTVERDMQNLSKGQFDVGFLVEGGYGRDFFFTHSNGILDQNNKAGGTGPDDQPDLLQAYVTVGIPLGTGVTITAGKFVSLLGYEKIDPTQNLFYSHSYGFSFGEPFTETGILASYSIADPATQNNMIITAGISRGWNQTLYDNNSSPDGLVQVKDFAGSFNWTANLLLGPEGVLPYGPSDNQHIWIVPEGILTYKASDQLDATMDLLYGDSTTPVEKTQWFSAALYAQYRLDPHLNLNGRLEFYHDGNGVTTGVGGEDINYEELTLGVGIIPMPDSPLLQSLTIRPELRVDYAEHPAFDFSKYSQVTGSIDIYWKF